MSKHYVTIVAQHFYPFNSSCFSCPLSVYKHVQYHNQLTSDYVVDYQTALYARVTVVGSIQTHVSLLIILLQGSLQQTKNIVSIWNHKYLSLI